MLNADADLATIQDLLGHSCITTTQRYCKVSNLKVQRDYFKAMQKVEHRGGSGTQRSGRSKPWMTMLSVVEKEP